MRKEKEITLFKGILIILNYVIGIGLFYSFNNIIKLSEGKIALLLNSLLIVVIIKIGMGLCLGTITQFKVIEGGLFGYIGHYYSEFFGQQVGRNLEKISGGYQIIIYFPAILAISAITFTRFLFNLLELEIGIWSTYIISALILVFIHFFNKNDRGEKYSIFGGGLKLVIIGIVFIIAAFKLRNVFDSLGLFNNIYYSEKLISKGSYELLTMLQPLLYLLFMFDGFLLFGSLVKKVKDPLKNVPKIYIYSAIILSVIYSIYIVIIINSFGMDTLATHDDYIINNFVNKYGFSGFDKIMNIMQLLGSLAMINAIYRALYASVKVSINKNILIITDKLLLSNRESEKEKINNLVIILGIFYLGLYFILDYFVGGLSSVILVKTIIVFNLKFI
jgi:amino acid transporter